MRHMNFPCDSSTTPQERTRARRATLGCLITAMMAMPLTLGTAYAEPPTLAGGSVETTVATAALAPSPGAVTPAPVNVPVTPVATPAPPAQLRDVAEWVAYKNARHLDALPAEARLFHRRGIMAHQSGRTSEAIRDLRGAIELDPSFMMPHLTLASWSLFREPGEAFGHLGAVVARVRQDFDLQLGLLADVWVYALEALFVGLIAVGLLILLHRRDQLLHPLQEELSRWISPRTARWWVPVLLVVPYLCGLGLLLPTLGLLAFLMPHLKPRERVLTMTLAVLAIATPLAGLGFARLSQALRTDAAPFYEMPLVQNAPWDATRQSRLERTAVTHPNDGFAQFALAWHSRRGGRLDVAEQAYRRARQAWPDEAAAAVDLGNVLAMRGREDEALALYREALTADPNCAAAHFNASQLLLRRFDYAAANLELSAASAIDFDLVRGYQARTGDDGALTLIDRWPSPTRSWHALMTTPVALGHAVLPLAMRGPIEARGWPFSVAVLVVMLVGLALGRWQHRRLPLRRCSNCAVTMCRRCARRRHEAVLCRTCDRIARGAESVEFAQRLLQRHHFARRDRMRRLRTAVAALIPGLGLVTHARVFGPTFMLASTWLMGRLLIAPLTPYSLTPRLDLPGETVPPWLLVCGIAFVYVWSLLAYAIVTASERAREARLEAATRGRITQSTARTTGLAA